MQEFRIHNVNEREESMFSFSHLNSWEDCLFSVQSGTSYKHIHQSECN